MVRRRGVCLLLAAFASACAGCSSRGRTQGDGGQPGDGGRLGDGGFAQDGGGDAGADASPVVELPPDTRWVPCGIAAAAITQLAYARGGGWLAVARADGRVISIRLEGAAARILDTHAPVPPLVDLSEDGGLLATSANGQVRLWSVADGSVVRSFTVADAASVALQFSDAPSPLLLATVDETAAPNDNVRVWQASDGAEVATLSARARATFTYADRAVLIIDEAAGRFDVLSFEGERLRQVAFPQPLGSIATAPDGAFLSGVLAAGRADERIALLSVGDDVFAWTSRVPSRATRGLVLLENPSRVLQLAEVPRLYDHASGEVLLEPASLVGATVATAAPDGSELAILGTDGRVQLVSTADGSARPAPISLFGMTQDLQDFTAARDARRIALRGRTRTQVVDLEGPRLLASIPTAPGSDVALSPDGTLLAVAGSDGFALLRVGDGARVLALPAAAPQCRERVGFSPDGSGFARAACSAITVYTLDGSPVRTLSSRVANPAITYSPDGSRLASSAPEVFDLATGAAVWSQPLPAAPADSMPDSNAVVYSGDGQLLLVSRSIASQAPAARDEPVADAAESFLFNAKTGLLRRSFGTAFGARPSLSPDGRWIAGDGQVLFVDSERPVALPGAPTTATFLPDGRLLATRATPVLDVLCPTR